MRHTEHGGWLQSYNVQVTTETQNNFIVGVQVTSDQNDTQQLLPLLDTVQQLTGSKPEQIVADEGYVTRDNLQGVAAAHVELIAPVPDEFARNAAARSRLGIADDFDASVFQQHGDVLRCPAGHQLVIIGQKVHHGLLQRTYAAASGTCDACVHKSRCCPKAGRQGRLIHRVVEHESVLQHAQRMSTERCRNLYRLRSRVGEFCQMRWKGNWRWRRFALWGKEKAQREVLWMALAFNFSQWSWARAKANRA